MSPHPKKNNLKCNFTVYIINLKKDKDRKKNIVSELKRQNIDNYKFIDAIKGSDLTADKKKSHVFKNKKNEYKWHIKLNDGQIGCSLSHIKAYKEILKNNDEIALIFEDDAVFIKDLTNELTNAILDSFNKNAQIVLLNELHLFYKKPIKKINGNEIVSVIKSFSSHSYFINKVAAANIIDFNYPVKTVADDHNLFNLYCDINYYGINPSICGQSQIFSSNINSSFEVSEIKKIEKTIKFYQRHILYTKKLHNLKTKFLKNLFPSKLGSHTKYKDLF